MIRRMPAVKNLNSQKYGQIHDEIDALLPNLTADEQRKKVSPAMLPQSITQLDHHPGAAKQATDRKTIRRMRAVKNLNNQKYGINHGKSQELEERQEYQLEYLPEHQPEIGQDPEDEPEQEQIHAKHYPTKPLDLEENLIAYPPYDPGSTTKTLGILTTSVGALAAVACLAYGSFILTHYDVDVGLIDFSDTAIPGEKYAFKSAIWPKVASFLINLALTLCIEGMMSIHSVSLRWALYDEGRLEWNTNLRLFTSSRKSGPNRWYVNALMLFCLVLTYAASSAMFPLDHLGNRGGLNDYDTSPNVDGRIGVFHVNGVAVLAMGVGLAGQAVVASWCLFVSSATIPTWSSNPLNVTLTTLHHGQFTHQSGRCMLSVHQRHRRPSHHVFPSKKQQSICQAVPSVRLIIGFLWILAVLNIAWAVATTLIRRAVVPPISSGFNWDDPVNPFQLQFSPAQYYNFGGTIYSTSTQAALCVLFIGLVQSLQTIGSHCAELLVNVSRDEASWRHVYSDKQHNSAKGARLKSNPILDAVMYWESLVLLIAKALLHWMMGQAMTPAITTVEVGQRPGKQTGDILSKDSKFMYEFDVVFNYTRLVIYSILFVLLAVFTSHLALRRRDGCLPATMGHLPTLANLIDDWRTDNEGRMWWGDKASQSRSEDTSIASQSSVVRHAGTSPKKAQVGPIYANRPYAG
ncbi:hypothetical protein MY10362_004282 [Beauveria mimosiformis]